MTTKISEYLVPIYRFGRLGIVHSIFKHSFNIEVAEQLIHINFIKNTVVSFGIAMTNTDYSHLLCHIQVGDRVVIRDGEFCIYTMTSTIKLVINNPEIIPVHLVKQTINTHRVTDLLDILMALDVTNRIGLQPQDRVMREIKQLFFDHRQVNTLTQYRYVKRLIDHLIGRGQGLTPAGDDILYGLIYVLLVCSHHHTDSWLKYLCQVSFKTTKISQTYLNGLRLGQVNEELIALQQALLSNELNVKNIRTILFSISTSGQTSGWDMLFGMILGLLLIKNEKKENYYVEKN